MGVAADEVADRSSRTDRLLGLVGTDPPDVARSKVDSFRTVLFLATGTEALMEAGRSASWREGAGAWLLGLGLMLAAGAALSFAGRSPRALTGLAGVALLVAYAVRFPDTANHHYLVLFLLLLMTFFDTRRESDRVPLLQGIRFTIAILFCYTGVQKLWYGLYFQGEYFAYFIAAGTRFVDFFRVVLPEAELARLQALGPAAAGSGPYRIEWLPFVLVANAVVWAEVLLPIALLWRKTRTAGVAGSVLLIIAIEMGARELIFGSMFTATMLLFARRDVNRALLPAYVALYATMILLSWIAPGLGFA